MQLPVYLHRALHLDLELPCLFPFLCKAPRVFVSGHVLSHPDEFIIYGAERAKLLKRLFIIQQFYMSLKGIINIMGKQIPDSTGLLESKYRNEVADAVQRVPSLCHAPLPGFRLELHSLGAARFWPFPAAPSALPRAVPDWARSVCSKGCSRRDIVLGSAMR